MKIDITDIDRFQQFGFMSEIKNDTMRFSFISVNLWGG